MPKNRQLIPFIQPGRFRYLIGEVRKTPYETNCQITFVPQQTNGFVPHSFFFLYYIYQKEVHFLALLNPETPAPPRHIAIIMDGNGRWAKKRGLPRTAGHAAGAEAFRRIANYCRSLGVEYLTVYAFSTENWKRSADEIAGIMKLLRRYLEEALADMEKNRVRFRFFGDLSKLSPDLQKLCRDAENRSEEYDVQVNFCLNYGGRDEIVHAVKAIMADAAAGKVRPDDLTEQMLSGYLYSAGVPDPELIIRPSGEQRTSNFLLWQSAYSEYVFMDVLWPDFSPEDLDRAIAEYHRRSRRFGGV